MTGPGDHGLATRGALLLSTLAAGLGASALAVEFAHSLRDSFAEGRSFLEALFLFFRFFTILTNVGIAILMAANAASLLRNRALPAAWIQAAALVYVFVVGVTYEAMLRRLWSPQGLQFYSDMVLHDIVPALTLLFWIAFAPKTPLAWRDPLVWLVYPTLYFLMTLFAGYAGEGYPYFFLNVDKIGYAGMIGNAVLFLVAFYAIGLTVTAAARVLPNPSLMRRAKSRFARNGHALRTED